MKLLDSKKNPDWLALALDGVRVHGFAIVTNVIEDSVVRETCDRMYAVQEAIVADLGRDRLDAAGELGVLRGMILYDEWFLRLLEIPAVLAVVDATVSSTAIMHLQNGFILPSFEPSEAPRVFQNKFHMDFRRVLNGYLASINVLMPLVDFHEENGATLVVAGTHQGDTVPSDEYLDTHAIPAECPAGSMVVFDSTVYHAAGQNRSGKDRLSINHQFTRSFFKQQIDYVRLLGDEAIEALPARTQQLLGWYTRVVTSLDEYYRPAHERLYRADQG